MAGRRSETHIHTSLPTRPHRWLVAGQRRTYTHTHVPAYKTTLMAGRPSETHTRTSLPTRPHRWLVAGQRHTHTHPCLQDRRDGWSPVRDAHTHTHTRPCLQDHTDGWSPVRDTHTHVPAYKTAQMAGRRSETHTHTSLPTRPHRWLVAGQRHRFKSDMYSEVKGNWSHRLALQAGAAVSVGCKSKVPGV